MFDIEKMLQLQPYSLNREDKAERYTETLSFLTKKYDKYHLSGMII